MTPPAGYSPVVRYGLKAQSIIIIGISVFQFSVARAEGNRSFQEWDEGIQTKGGKAEGCYLKNKALSPGGTLVTSNLSVFAKRQGENRIVPIFTLKVVAAQIERWSYFI